MVRMVLQRQLAEPTFDVGTIERPRGWEAEDLTPFALRRPLWTGMPATAISIAVAFAATTVAAAEPAEGTAEELFPLPLLSLILSVLLVLSGFPAALLFFFSLLLLPFSPLVDERFVVIPGRLPAPELLLGRLPMRRGRRR